MAEYFDAEGDTHAKADVCGVESAGVGGCDGGGVSGRLGGGCRVFWED